MRTEITCPFCFATFNDDEVHFRMNRKPWTEKNLNIRLDDENGNPKTYNTLEEIAKNAPDSQTKRLNAEANRRLALLEQGENSDNRAKYEQFWKPFGGTSEKISDDDTDYRLPVYDPRKDTDFFQYDSNGNPQWITEKDGFVKGVFDKYWDETDTRVCPECHNPLPNNYGRYPVKFISMIGVTSSGKTVYLSRLCDQFKAELHAYGIAVEQATGFVIKYQRVNRIAVNEKLPGGTLVERFEQPLCFHLGRTFGDGTHQNLTLVFYDIAGENFTKDDEAVIGTNLKSYGPFVGHSDGMIYLIDPNQFNTGKQRPEKALETLHSAGFIEDGIGTWEKKKGKEANKEKEREKIKNMKLAVCLSKADAMKDYTITATTVAAGKRFDAGNYNNSVYVPLEKLLSKGAGGGNLWDELEQYSSHATVFAVSALGKDARTRTDEENVNYLDAMSSPLRLAEPVAWMLSQWPLEGTAARMVDSSGFICERRDWQCEGIDRQGNSKPHRVHFRTVEKDEGESVKVVPELYCSRHRLYQTSDGQQWKCPNPKCGIMNASTVEWCQGKHCTYNRWGDHKVLGLIVKAAA